MIKVYELLTKGKQVAQSRKGMQELCYLWKSNSGQKDYIYYYSDIRQSQLFCGGSMDLKDIIWTCIHTFVKTVFQVHLSHILEKRQKGTIRDGS